MSILKGHLKFTVNTYLFLITSKAALSTPRSITRGSLRMSANSDRFFSSLPGSRFYYTSKKGAHGLPYM